MTTTRIPTGAHLALLTCVFLAACASRPELMPKSAIVPPGVDLSGQWQLRTEPGTSLTQKIGPELRIRIPPHASRRNPGRQVQKGGANRSSGTAAHIFLETGESLKIIQTRDGVFISFDRAVVEEYTFGENRTVSVGPIEAQRVSGWQDGYFIVETLDEQGVILTESWHLDEGGDVLVRDVSLQQGEDEQFATRHRFDRIVAGAAAK